MAINKVVKILMDRDGMSKKDATRLVEDTRDLGLEPDYIFDIINV